MDTIKGITFDVTGWVEQPPPPTGRVWHNDRGDGMGLYYFSIPPDIPASLDAIDRLRQKYRSMTSGGVIQLDVLQVDGIPTVKLILKIPQQPRGVTYVGSFTFPRRHFSYVLKIQCLEYGTTGIREAVIADEELAAGRVKIDKQGRLQGWGADAYDRTVQGAFGRNLAEDERYDSRFPDHPLSRLRRYLAELEKTVVVSDAVRGAAPFAVKGWSRWFR